MAELRVVAQHFHVDGADQELTHLLLRQIPLKELLLQDECLASDDLVFLLLTSRFANAFD